MELEQQSHYPYPLPATGPFNEVNSKINYPVASALADQVVSIPIFPELEDEEINILLRH